MNKNVAFSAILAASAILGGAASGRAAIVITEVDSAGSSATSGYAMDWIELTNTGTTAVDITGWAMDDSSASFSTAVPLRGVTSIAAGQTVVFAENGTDASTDAAQDQLFKTTWFSSNVPSNFVMGNYGGSGVGLSTSGDGVNIFNAAGALQASVSFLAPTGTSTFDYVAGAGVPSVVGVDGAFTSANGEVGSPGTTGTSAVPEPASLGLLGLGVVGMISRRRRA